MKFLAQENTTAGVASHFPINTTGSTGALSTENKSIRFIYTNIRTVQALSKDIDAKKDGDIKKDVDNTTTNT